MINIMIKIVHCRKDPHDIYIGRGSKWGNPYRIGIDGNREDVIKMYENYLLGYTDLMNSLEDLKDKILGCYCAPLACHGDILKKYVEK